MLGRGGDQFSIEETQAVELYRRDNWPAWMEAVWVDGSGTIFGWYHQEQHGVCPGTSLAVPRIGAAVSWDGGFTFYDLGIVLSSGDPIDCTSANGYFAGGHGDFTVIPDRQQNYLYFLFSNYGGFRVRQGVAIARMAVADRYSPVGRVYKYFAGKWEEPGNGGRMTPILPARVSWQRPNTNAYWGPSVHWNTYLESYVMLLNHACCQPGWPQTGIYISYNADLSNPRGWTRPEMVLDDHGWYPQVLGLGPGETDSVAGAPAGVAFTCACTARPRSLPADLTTMRPGPDSAVRACSNALAPSCEPKCDPSERLTTAVCPRCSSIRSQVPMWSCPWSALTTYAPGGSDAKT